MSAASAASAAPTSDTPATPGSASAASATPPQRWRLADGLVLAWRDWDEDEVVVFSAGLGHSLLLSAPAARILAALEQAAPEAVDLAVLLDRLLASCTADTERSEAEALLDASLAEFYRIGLVEPRTDRP